jgi:hypothetical protein
MHEPYIDMMIILDWVEGLKRSYTHLNRLTKYFPIMSEQKQISSWFCLLRTKNIKMVLPAIIDIYFFISCEVSRHYFQVDRQYLSTSTRDIASYDNSRSIHHQIYDQTNCIFDMTALFVAFSLLLFFLSTIQ